MRAIHSIGLLFAFLQLGDCDVYLHNPRGSNNRLNSRSTNRRNANRVFDSQNNAKGGYNVGNHYVSRRRYQYHMNYLMSGPPGSNGETYMDIEWTNQHGCGDEDLNCQIVLQYMCQPHSDSDLKSNSIPNRKRNGFTESTPRYQRHNQFRNKAQKDFISKIHSSHPNYALNEPWPWYDKCQKRDRNKGLFTADQNLKRRHRSIHTRQNPNGKRYGYECPEERDYYPYWHPTDWIDIAVLADKQSDCSFYKSESFNVKPKGECMEIYPNDRRHFRHDSKYNNAADCTSKGGQWINFSNYLEKATQHKSQSSCEGAGLKWTYAYRSDDFDKDTDSIKKQCVVPLNEPDCRPAPYSRSNHLGNGVGLAPLTYRWKLPYYPSQQKQRCFLRIRYNISTNDPQNLIKNDPVVTFMGKLPLQLAINTAQFGRTFQDRSHMFLLNPRSNKVADNLDIYNVNVRGKRGNIVQVFPAVEYDFVPKRLEISANEAIHLQWTGSDTNPHGNAGEGARGTDRNNFVEMKNASYSYPVPAGSEMLKNAQVIHNFYGGSSQYENVEKNLAGSGVLNKMSPSFAGYVLKFQPGKHCYMCTRNNNFTNRNQKARLTVR